MSHRIRIMVGGVSVLARMDDSETAQAIRAALPFRTTASRWGDEIYFEIPVRLAEAADAREDMTVGELGYWPSGAAFCIFFGPTPVSDGPEPRAYSNVNPFGRVEGDADVLRATKTGDAVLVESVDDR